MSRSLGFALVTGASSGIGAVYADRLARRGYDLILVARDRVRLEALATRLRRETGVTVEVEPADLTNRYDLFRIEAQLSADKRITMLINNAGMSVGGRVIDANHDRLETMMQLNAVAPMRLGTAAASAFKSRNHGTIVNIASVLALLPERFNGVYSGTKAFLLNYTLGLQAELADTPVRVQAVLPGATRTEIWERSGASLDAFPPEMIMNADELVDAALAGLDLGEAVTIPSLPDARDWEAATAARLGLGPWLSRDHAAPRYGARPLH
jgi:short-subunit dehydrogenase